MSEPQGTTQAEAVETQGAEDAQSGIGGGDATPSPAETPTPVSEEAPAPEGVTLAQVREREPQTTSEATGDEATTSTPPAPSGQPEYQPRQIDLTLARVDPWSVMKMAFLLSVAAALALVLATLFVWLMLNMMHVFSSIEQFVDSIDSTGMVAELVGFLRLPRALALATVVGVANVVLLTALATVLALLYNRLARLVGGVRVVFQDE